MRRPDYEHDAGWLEGEVWATRAMVSHATA